MVADNGQNWDAADTPALLLAVLRGAAPAVRLVVEGRNHFVPTLHPRHALRRYEDVLALFRADGWSDPPRPPDEED